MPTHLCRYLLTVILLPTLLAEEVSIPTTIVAPPGSSDLSVNGQPATLRAGRLVLQANAHQVITWTEDDTFQGALVWVQAGKGHLRPPPWHAVGTAAATSGTGAGESIALARRRADEDAIRKLLRCHAVVEIEDERTVLRTSGAIEEMTLLLERFVLFTDATALPEWAPKPTSPDTPWVVCWRQLQGRMGIDSTSKAPSEILEPLPTAWTPPTRVVEVAVPSSLLTGIDMRTARVDGTPIADLRDGKHIRLPLGQPVRITFRGAPPTGWRVMVVDQDSASGVPSWHLVRTAGTAAGFGGGSSPAQALMDATRNARGALASLSTMVQVTDLPAQLAAAGEWATIDPSSSNTEHSSRQRTDVSISKSSLREVMMTIALDHNAQPAYRRGNTLRDNRRIGGGSPRSPGWVRCWVLLDGTVETPPPKDEQQQAQDRERAREALERLRQQPRDENTGENNDDPDF